MGANVTTTATVDRMSGRGFGSGGSPNGPGPNGMRRDGGSERGAVPDQFLPQKYKIGMWVAVAGIGMMFSALTSAYIVRSSASSDWLPISMPSVLWLSTALILASSATIHLARRRLSGGSLPGYRLWLVVTAALGFGFLGSQFAAWRQLVRQGVYLATNPHSSFFYLLTGAHAIHLAGGVLALGYVLIRAWMTCAGEAAGLRRRAATDAVTIYWHFMDALWIYLFALLFLWR